MIREFDELLAGTARSLLEIAGRRPEVAQQVGPAAGLLMLIAADVDTHVSRRLQEVEEMTAILRRSRDLLPAAGAHDVDRALTTRLVRPADFTLHNIESHVAGLRKALIGVHEWLETPEGREHPDLLDEVWAFLQSDADHAGRLAHHLW